ncbi:MAG: UDP-N-acetylmuramoyl-L-alanine--D-glutamate ligase [Lachnospiraceae bacterium]|nr:UDP-N-acetylmuramoyl-L-alanine--D-glutamate ligase [Lachnospiraceae bacterium]
MNEKRKYLVAGTGISGVGAVKLLAEIGAEIILYDGNSELTEEIIRGKLSNIKNAEMVDIVIGELEDEVIADIDIMVISPGIPTDAPFVNRVRLAGKKIWSEIELAYVFGKGKIAAITGTNGKTTTTALVGEIMKAHYDSVYVVGNIGNPYTEVALETKEESAIVAEVSSFQLETIIDFLPDVCAVLNVTPDHLNRHYTMENYTNIKMSIAKNQTSAQVCVLNYEDDLIMGNVSQISSKIVYFTTKNKLDEGIYLDGETIIYNDGDKEYPVVNINDMKLVGIHNVENVMAAIGISVHMGVSLETISGVIKEFKAVEHRIEFVREKDKVIYYNDSKGTNTDASIKAIQAMSRPTVLIAGGYDKGSEYDEWIEAFGNKIKALVLIGETKDKIADCAKRHGFKEIHFANTLEEAVKISAGLAEEESAVLLSPACASWDMFKSYEERGNLFKDYVNNL